AFVDDLDSNRFDVLQTELNGRNPQIVDRAVLEGGWPRAKVVAATPRVTGFVRGQEYRAAGIPRPPQLGERVMAIDQTANAGWVAEDLVERQRDKVGMPATEVK